MTKQSFSGYEKKRYVQTISFIEMTNYSSQDYNLPPFPRLGEKNKTDTTVFHFLVKSNLLGKLEISEEIELFWRY